MYILTYFQKHYKIEGGKEKRFKQQDMWISVLWWFASKILISGKWFQITLTLFYIQIVNDIYRTIGEFVHYTGLIEWDNYAHIFLQTGNIRIHSARFSWATTLKQILR